jgi:hypothetical protein
LRFFQEQHTNGNSYAAENAQPLDETPAYELPPAEEPPAQQLRNNLRLQTTNATPASKRTSNASSNCSTSDPMPTSL